MNIRIAMMYLVVSDEYTHFVLSINHVREQFGTIPFLYLLDNSYGTRLFSSQKFKTMKRIPTPCLYVLQRRCCNTEGGGVII